MMTKMVAWTVTLAVFVPVAAAQEQPQPPAPAFNFKPRPLNTLAGTSGPEWDGNRGVGRFSGIAYERELVPRLMVRTEFGQSYNGDGQETVRDFVSGGVPVRETLLVDFTRLVLGAQLSYMHPVGGSHVIALAGPVWTRVSRTEHEFLTDLRFGDTVQTDRRRESTSASGILYGGGLEFAIAEGFAWRVLLLHNRAGEQNATTLAFGGAVKF